LFSVANCPKLQGVGPAQERTSLTKFDPMPLAVALSIAGCAGAPPPFAPSASDQRLLVEPSALAVLSDAREGNTLPGAVTFGGAREQTLLLVSFEREWARSGNVRSALLRLTPREGAPRRSGPVTIHAARVCESWSDGKLDWANRPALGPPYAEASAGADGALAIDLTGFVRSAAKHPNDDYGIALSGERGADSEATFATGASGGQGPELELWLGL
jgi:hypothetical protein